MKYFLIALLNVLVCFQFNSQISGKVINRDTGLPLENAIVSNLEGKQVITDIEGNFSLLVDRFPTTLITKFNTLPCDTTIVYSSTPIIISLGGELTIIEAVVVTAGRRRQNVEEVAISMEILKPSLINNKAMTSLDQAVNQSPGVFAMDGQVSIRGGGGYAYGAGSRVLLIWNGIPMLSPDVGDVKWNSVPMENASQIEIIKGASSVLYGSGALNGIISMVEKEPSTKGELKVRALTGVFGDPKRTSLKWWTRNPMYHSIDVFNGKSFDRFGYTIGVNGFKNEGYKKGSLEDRARLSGSFFFKPSRNLKLGLFYSGQYQYTGNFILWENDSLGYIAQGMGSTLSYQKSIRLNIDPYIKYTDRFNNKHELKTRYYLVTTGDLTNIFASSKAAMYYANYQFQRQFAGKSTLTAGTMVSANQIISPVFGDHYSKNSALYMQYENKWKNLDFTIGTRAEYFEMDGKSDDSRFYLGNDTNSLSKIPVYPILRAGIHYALTKLTHFRASFGQGIRFPSVAERFAATSSGGVVIFPNPNLRPEVGWASELGVKQIIPLGDWKGMLDIAGFINKYSNMIEYTYGLYNPDTVLITPANLSTWIGFQAQNAEKAKITGVEFSFNSSGKIKNVEIISLIGYTYMSPISLNNNPNYTIQHSDSGTNMLKYRFKHLAKADIEGNYKKYSLGASCRYNSFMTNIDKVFLADLDPTNNELYVLPGLPEYREKFNQGSLVFDLRAGFKLNDEIRVAFLVNNLLNQEYTSRPADIQPPRTFLLQVQAEL